MPHSNTQNAHASLAVALVVALFAGILAAYYVPAYEGVDQNAYLCSARQLVLTGSTAKHTAHPLEYVSDNMVQTGEGVFYPKYPLGYPWLCALAYRLGGPEAVFLVSPILAALALVGMFLLGSSLVERASCAFNPGRKNEQDARSTSRNGFAGVLAMILLATSPWHACFGLAAMSHAGAIAFAVWGMFFLWRWVERGGRWSAALAGALPAYSYTIRYSEALLALPVVAMIVWRYWEVRRVRTSSAEVPPGRPSLHREWCRDVSWLAVGAMVVVGALWAHHWRAFGAPWRTGYGLCGESTGFGWSYFQANWWTMLTKLNGSGLGLIFPVGLVGLAYVLAHDRRRGVFLGLWIVPTILLYTAYYWAPDWEGPAYLRFFSGVFPALIVCALVLLCEAVKSRPAWTVALGVFIAVVATFNLRAALKETGEWSDRLRQFQRMAENVRRHVPDGSVVVSSGEALNNLEFAGDYELYSTETFDRNRLTWRTGVLQKAGPSPFQRRKAEALQNTLGKLNDGQLAALQRSLLATNVAAGRMVVLVASPNQMRNVRGRLGDAFRYHSLTEWYQVAFGKNGEMRPTLVALYRLEPRDSHLPVPESRAALEEQVDWWQFRVQTLRQEYDDQYPGARQKWEAIIAGEQQLRELRAKVQQLMARQPVSR